jgi:hypothetical protein
MHSTAWTLKPARPTNLSVHHPHHPLINQHFGLMKPEFSHGLVATFWGAPAMDVPSAILDLQPRWEERNQHQAQFTSLNNWLRLHCPHLGYCNREVIGLGETHVGYGWLWCFSKMSSFPRSAHCHLIGMQISSDTSGIIWDAIGCNRENPQKISRKSCSLIM